MANKVLLSFVLMSCVLYTVESKCHVTFPTDVLTPAHFFNVSLMEGMWYNSAVWTLEKQDNPPDFKCLSYNITSVDTPTDARIQEKIVFLESPDEVAEYTSNVVVDSVPLPALWQLFEAGTIIPNGKLVWLQTTYDNWALEHYCYQTVGYLRLWVRSPAFELDSHIRGILDDVARGYGFPPENLLPVQNEGCPDVSK